MTRLALLAAVLVGTGLVSANLSVKQIVNQAFKEPTVAELRKMILQSVVESHRRYKRPLSDSLISVVGKQGVDDAPTHTGVTVYNTLPGTFQHVVPMMVGSPGQLFRQLIDTGSPVLWLYGNDSRLADQGIKSYRADHSSTARKVDGGSLHISYVDGSEVEGDVFYDTITLGNMTVPRQAFGVVRTYNDHISNQRVDGILGLARDVPTPVDGVEFMTPKMPQLFSQLRPQLSQPIFTIDLHSKTPGTLNFGFIDRAAYTGPVGYSRVVQGEEDYGMWTIPMTAFQVANRTVVNYVKVQATLDTGTPLAYLPTATLDAYFTNVTGAKRDPELGGLWVVPCQGAPDLTLHFGRVAITIPGPLVGRYQIDENDSSKCFSVIQDSGDDHTATLGQPFYFSALVVHDVGAAGRPPRVGLASKPWR